ncbi:arginase family protein [Plantactinospora sp. WMMB782]|uniref:arginase family protein n=1 Tax=Plantactinospora sp. WMMB782 TaxID=3404121 RepID=UPI003B93BBCF
MDARWGLLGVPSSAGAHTPGLEKGPAAIREAGLADLLPGGVEDHGDLPPFRWRPDRDRPDAKNVAAVARVAAATALGVTRILDSGQIPLVIGGDCSITVGVVAGFVQRGVRPALLYVDGGPDLYTPATRPNGNLDAMGLAHLLAIPGHVPALAGIAGTAPLLTPRDVVAYAHALPPGDLELRLLDELGITHLHADEVHADPAGAAGRARREIEALGAPFVLHCDVDVLSFVDVPLADVPDSGGDPVGLRLAELAVSLAVFAASPRFAGLVLTEVNPDHAPDPGVLRHFVEVLASALAGPVGARPER